MKKLEIVYTKSKLKFAPFSWIVQVFTRKKYSHVAIKLTQPGWNTCYYQASQGMVHYMSESIFLKKNKILKSHKLIVPGNLYNNIILEASNNLGKPYAWLQNIGIGVAIMLRLVGISIQNPFTGGKNCSELVYTALLKPMLGNTIDHNPQLVTPADIEHIVEEKCKMNLLPNQS